MINGFGRPDEIEEVCRSIERESNVKALRAIEELARRNAFEEGPQCSVVVGFASTNCNGL
jgi:hypothetical protein